MNAELVEPVLPAITDLNRPFWDGCKAGRLMVQRCGKCGELRYPAAIRCPVCLAVEADWVALSGRAEVFSYVVFDRAYHPAWKDKVPYAVALIETEEGLMMVSNVVGASREELAIGLKVEVDFEPIDGEVTKPVFRPRR